MFVLDCSMTMAWAFRDETTPGTLDALELAAREACVAPGVWPLEVCNAVLTAQRRGRFTSDDVPLFLALVGRLRVSVDEGGLQRAFDDVLPLAMQHALSIYDAAYLELALRTKAPLATLDAGLARAARAAGVEVIGAA
ncbi:MAG: type II toxin-antitoxin system VapC family toxin [Actinomycetes bacterium]